MKKWILALVFLLLSQIINASDFVKGSASFLVDESDKVSFIKKQLVFKALKEIITKELDSMGLKSNLFWEKYDEKFRDSFLPYEDALKKRYKIETDEDARKNQWYLKELRQKRLEFQLRYGGLLKLMSSYLINKITKSTETPELRYIDLSAKINRKELASKYVEFVQNYESKKYAKMSVALNLSFDGFGLNDFQVENSEEFKDKLANYFKNWAESSLGTWFEKIEVIVKKNEIKNLERKFLFSSTASNEEEATNELLLEVKINIEKVDEDIPFEKKSYVFSVSSIGFDYDLKKIIAFTDAKKEKITFKQSPSIKSQFASYLFKLASENMKLIKNHVTEVNNLVTREKWKIEGEYKITDLYEFIDKLTNLGASLNLKVGLEEIKSGQALLDVELIGTAEKMSDFFHQVKGMKFGQGVSVSDIINENGVEFKLISDNHLSEDKLNNGQEI